jgi:hypothetical protein
MSWVTRSAISLKGVTHLPEQPGPMHFGHGPSTAAALLVEGPLEGPGGAARR